MNETVEGCDPEQPSEEDRLRAGIVYGIADKIAIMRKEGNEGPAARLLFLALQNLKPAMQEVLIATRRAFVTLMIEDFDIEKEIQWFKGNMSLVNDDSVMLMIYADLLMNAGMFDETQHQHIYAKEIARRRGIVISN
jgi:hypothetical protein